MPTRLSYFRNSALLSTQATVTVTSPGASSASLIVRFDNTIFHPSGGGQPSDQGLVRSGIFVAKMLKATHAEDEVDHVVNGDEISKFLFPGAVVTQEVDEAMRWWHCRLHSAGHVLDAGLERLGVFLPTSRTYLHGDGPFIEYVGTLEGDKNEFMAKLDTACKEIIAEDHSVFIKFSDEPDDHKCHRTMRIGNLITIPCGGTHVQTLKQIGNMSIRKIDTKKGKVKICYVLDN